MQTDGSPTTSRVHALRRIALTSYFALLALTLLWEGWLAPKTPPGLWLTIKSLPLLLPLFGLLRGRPRSYAWASLLLLLYFMEGVMLLYLHRAEGIGAHRVFPYALLETILVLSFIASAAYYVRQSAAGATRN
jgi:uncharacterized membrane protein